MPVYPCDALPDVLPHLGPMFAHYVGQWPKVIVEDSRLTDARGFYVEAAQLPDRIAEPPACARPRRAHPRPRADAAYWGEFWGCLWTREGEGPGDSNSDEFCVPAEEAGIDLYPSGCRTFLTPVKDVRPPFR